MYRASHVHPLLVIGLVLCVTCVSPPYGSTQDCAYYADYTHHAASEIAGSAYGVAVDGHYAYLATTETGLRVVDISDPEDPEEVGALPATSIWGRYLEVNDTLVYIADHDFGVWVADISDPTSPEVVDSVSLPGNPVGLDLAGQHLYIAAKEAGLYVFSVATPEHPVQVGHIGLGGITRRVIIEDSIAYVADKEGMLKVLDVSDPTSPDSIGSAATGGLLSIAKSGNYVYAIGGFTLYVVDVSDPSSPLIVDDMPTEGTGHDSAIHGSVLYIANDYYKVTPYDISSPASPVCCGNMQIGYDNPKGITCADGYCFVATSLGLRTFEIGNGQLLKPVAECWPLTGDLEVVVPFGSDYAFGTGVGGQCHVFDIQDPLTPVRVGGLTVPRGSCSPSAAVTYVEGNYIGVGGWCDGVYVFDLSDPAAPDTLCFVDCMRPWAMYGYVLAMDVDSDYAFVTFEWVDEDFYSGCDFNVIDLSIPDSAYIASRNSWCGVSMDVCGDYVYLASGTGITILNISDPAPPQYVNALTLPGGVETIVLDSGYAYAGYTVGGGAPATAYLQVLDASDPETLATLGSVMLPRVPWDIDILAGHAYICTPGCGLFVCDVLDPDNPYVEGTLFTRDKTMQAALIEGYVLAADDEGGLQVGLLDCSAKAGVVASWDRAESGPVGPQGLVSACPNPFRGKTQLAFSLAERGRVRLSIYDVKGTRVAELVDGTLDAGLHTATFEGGAVAPGIYFALLETRGKSLAKKVVLVK